MNNTNDCLPHDRTYAIAADQRATRGDIHRSIGSRSSSLSMPRLRAALVDAGADRSVFGTRTAAAASALNLHLTLLQLVLAVEDKRFWLHLGFDPAAIVRALVMILRGRGRLQGGSTIPEQLVKTYGRQFRSRTPMHRIVRCIASVALTLTTDKQSVLVQYLDSVYFGRTYFGVQSAAMGYFLTSAATLSPSQGFFLAERIALPNKFRPERVRNILSRRIVRSILGPDIQTLPSVYGERFGQIAERQVAHILIQVVGAM